MRVVGSPEMASSNSTPTAKIAMIGILVETILYGVNCVMYGLCMFILLHGRSIPRTRWVLAAMSTIVFLLCTIHVGASLQQLLDGFVYVPSDVPDYSEIYWLDYTTSLVVLKDNVFDTLVLSQYCILIWRLYVVFMYNWKVIICPIILATACVGVSYATSVFPILSVADFHHSVTSRLLISGWTLDLILNLSVTAAIAIRLWWIDRSIASLMTTRTNRYATSIYVVIESGAIFATISVSIILLYGFNSPSTVSVLHLASQLAGLTPLLIIVQVALAGRYHIQGGDSSRTAVTVQDEITFRAGPGVLQEQDS